MSTYAVWDYFILRRFCLSRREIPWRAGFYHPPGGSTAGKIKKERKDSCEKENPVPCVGPGYGAGAAAHYGLGGGQGGDQLAARWNRTTGVY